MQPKVFLPCGPRSTAFHEQKLTLFAALEPGTLVKDGYFSLMESVGSIEVCILPMD
jgi:hypothetical protein